MFAFLAIIGSGTAIANRDFLVRVAKFGPVVWVEEDETILRVFRARGVTVPSMFSSAMHVTFKSDMHIC